VSGLSLCLSKAHWQKAACTRNNGHEQLISKSAWFKPAFAKTDKKQSMVDLRGFPTKVGQTGLKTSYVLR
jgi:hypothetical protein